MLVYQMQITNNRVYSKFYGATTVPSQTINENFLMMQLNIRTIKRAKNNHMSSNTGASMQPTVAGD